MSLTQHQDPYSQDLPAYALGALDRDDRLAVEAHLARCESCRFEAQELLDASASLALLAPALAPPASVKQGLLRRFDGEARERPGLAKRVAARLAPAAWATWVRGLRFRRRLSIVVPAMSLTGALVIAVVAFTNTGRLHGRVQSLERQMNSEATTVSVLASSVDSVAGDVDSMRRASFESQTTVSRVAEANQRLQQIIRNQFVLTALAASPAAATTYFTGVGEARNAGAVLVSGSPGNPGWMMVYGMPDPGPGRVYQLWLFHNGQRLNLGTFSVDPFGYAWLRVSLPQYDARYENGAVTAEPVGGSDEPTGIKVLVVAPE